MRLTEKELIRLSSQKIVLIEKMLWEGEYSAEEINSEFNANGEFLHLNDPDKITITWMPKAVCEHQEWDLEKTKKLDLFTFVKKHIHPSNDIGQLHRLFDARKGIIAHPLHTTQVFRTSFQAKWLRIHNAALYSSRLNSFVKISQPFEELGNRLIKSENKLAGHEFFIKNFDRFISLTKKEKEVLSQLATGMLNEEISSGMGVSGNTIRKHKQHIDEKLELTNRNINKGAYYTKYALAYGLVRM